MINAKIFSILDKKALIYNFKITYSHVGFAKEVTYFNVLLIVSSCTKPIC